MLGVLWLTHWPTSQWGYFMWPQPQSIYLDPPLLPLLWPPVLTPQLPLNGEHISAISLWSCLNILCVLGFLQSLDLSSPFTYPLTRISMLAGRYLNFPYYHCKMPNTQASDYGT